MGRLEQTWANLSKPAQTWENLSKLSKLKWQHGILPYLQRIDWHFHWSWHGGSQCRHNSRYVILWLFPVFRRSEPLNSLDLKVKRFKTKSSYWQQGLGVKYALMKIRFGCLATDVSSRSPLSTAKRQWMGWTPLVVTSTRVIPDKGTHEMWPYALPKAAVLVQKCL